MTPAWEALLDTVSGAIARRDDNLRPLVFVHPSDLAAVRIVLEGSGLGDFVLLEALANVRPRGVFVLTANATGYVDLSPEIRGAP